MGFDLKDLQAVGLLTEYDRFVNHAVKDEDGKELTENQILRCYGAEFTGTVRGLVQELTREGLNISPDYIGMVAQAMRHQWEQIGRFPLDPEKRPEPFNRTELPLVVRNQLVRTNIPWETLDAMRDLVRRYRGDFLRADLEASGKEFYSDQTFADLLRAERQQPVVTRVCINSGCGQLARTSLEQAVAAIEKYRLLPQSGQPWSGKLFTPHQRCMNCRSQGRRETAAASPRHTAEGRRPRRQAAFACLHDDPRARRALEQAPVTPSPEMPQGIVVPAEPIEA
jgi:hypothetical protein